jgi:hypothetical protein
MKTPTKILRARLSLIRPSTNLGKRTNGVISYNPDYHRVVRVPKPSAEFLQKLEALRKEMAE